MDNKFQKAFSLVEAVIAITIFSLVLLALFVLWNFILGYSLGSTNRVQATYLAEEGIEAVKVIRDRGWTDNISTLDTDQIFYLEFNGTSWYATTTNVFIDSMFERTVLLENVERDINSDIVETGLDVDPETRKVTVAVSWSYKGATSTKSVSTYITNVFDN